MARRAVHRAKVSARSVTAVSATACGHIFARIKIMMRAFRVRGLIEKNTSDSFKYEIAMPTIERCPIFLACRSCSVLDRFWHAEVPRAYMGDQKHLPRDAHTAHRLTFLLSLFCRLTHFCRTATNSSITRFPSYPPLKSS